MRKTKTTNVKPNDTLLTGVIAVSAAIAFMGGYVLSGDLNKSYSNLTKSKSNTYEGVEIAGASIGGSTLEGTTLGFNENYVVSEGEFDYNYELGSYSSVGDSYLNFEYGNKKSEVKVLKYYYDNDKNEEFTISFDKNVVDVHISTFDMNSDYSTALFLLDDGSVEYVLLERAIETSNFEPNGKLEDLKNIVKFYEGTACEKGTPICNKTTFAQSMNGKIYNLYDYIVG